MRTIGVDAGLEPHPGVAVFGVGEPLGDFKLHRVAACHCDVDLARADLDRITDRIAAHVSNLSGLTDQRNLCRRLVHPLAHGRLEQVDHHHRLKEIFQLVALH